MNVPKLVGAVAPRSLENNFNPTQSQSTGRFVLNLSPEQVAAVAHAVIADPFLTIRSTSNFQCRTSASSAFPRTRSHRPTTYYRNASCAKAAYLLAEVEHDEQASLNELTRLGPPELLERIDLWVREVADGLGLAPEQFRWWEKCLTGLRDLRLVSLDRFAAYLLRTRESDFRRRNATLASAWRCVSRASFTSDEDFFTIKERLVDSHPTGDRFRLPQKKGQGLLRSRPPVNSFSAKKSLQTRFNNVEHEIPDIRHPTIEAFITSPSGWNAPGRGARGMRMGGVRALFDGLQRERFTSANPLWNSTMRASPLSFPGYDRDYLSASSNQPHHRHIDDDEDIAFYDSHRTELKADRKLKSAWDRFRLWTRIPDH